MQGLYKTNGRNTEESPLTIKRLLASSQDSEYGWQPHKKRSRPHEWNDACEDSGDRIELTS